MSDESPDVEPEIPLIAEIVPAPELPAEPVERALLADAMSACPWCGHLPILRACACA